CEDYSLVEVRRLDSSSVSVHAHSFDREQQVCVLPGTEAVSHETVTPVKVVHLDLADTRAGEAHQADRSKHLGARNEHLTSSYSCNGLGSMPGKRCCILAPV